MNAHVFHQSVPIKNLKNSPQEAVAEDSYFMLADFFSY